MTKDIPYNKPSFLHWEGHPTNSRAVLTAGEAFKTGELLVFTAKGYEPYKGTALTADATKAPQGVVVAIALEDAAKGGKAACIVRVATVMKDKLTGVAADAFDIGKPLAGFDAHFSRQQIALVTSIDAQRAFK